MNGRNASLKYFVNWLIVDSKIMSLLVVATLIIMSCVFDKLKKNAAPLAAMKEWSLSFQNFNIFVKVHEVISMIQEN